METAPSPTRPDVSLVIPAYNRADLLEKCLASLYRSEGVTWEATVVDNASPEDLSGVAARFPELRWLRMERNLGYAAANNRGLEGARGRHVCYLNSDAELFPDTLAGLARYLDTHPEAGAVTPCNVGPDGLPQHTLSPEHTLQMAWLRDSGFHLLFPNAPPFRGWMLPDFDFEREQEVAHAQTTCLLIRAEAYQQSGGMDESLFLFYNDVDFCRRLRTAGWKLVYLPQPRVLHHGSASVETAPWKERQLWRDRYRFFRRWYGTRGTLGVRFACLHRSVTRTLAQLVQGRPGNIAPMWRHGLDLYRALSEEYNGG
ncbi:MAG: glycosyltransferase family 2 protein [Armatimonadota bacterium]